MCLMACSVKRDMVWFQQDVPERVMTSDLVACRSRGHDARETGHCMQAKGYLLIPQSESELLTVRSLQQEGYDEQQIAAYLCWDKEKVLRYIDENYELTHTDSLGRQPVDILTIVGKSAVEPLIAGLRDNDPLVRRQAAEALGLIEDQRAVGPLITLLKDKDSLIRRHAVKALGRIKDRRGVPPLIAVLNDKDEKSHVKASAAKALGWIGEPDAVESLVAALKDAHWTVRSRAANALGTIRDPRAVEPLISMLEDEDPLVRGYAVDALGEIEDARAMEALQAALTDPDRDVRKRVEQALTKITEKDIPDQ